MRYVELYSDEFANFIVRPRSAVERIKSITNSDNPIGNGTHDFPACSGGASPVAVEDVQYYRTIKRHYNYILKRCFVNSFQELRDFCTATFAEI